MRIYYILVRIAGKTIHITKTKKLLIEIVLNTFYTAAESLHLNHGI